MFQPLVDSGRFVITMSEHNDIRKDLSPFNRSDDFLLIQIKQISARERVGRFYFIGGSSTRV